MIKYKLTMVEERTAFPAGTKSPIVTYREVSLIGYFESEKKLAGWAKESDGCLAEENQ